MEVVDIDIMDISDYVKEMLLRGEVKPISFGSDNKEYHHNAPYKKAPSIINWGILSLEDQKILGLVDYSDDKMKMLDDNTSHINGTSGISLSVVGMDDLYPGEDEYIPYLASQVDFLVSNKIKAQRETRHYGNEYISYQAIKPEDLMSVDVRLFNFLKQFDISKLGEEDKISFVDRIVERYNCLADIAKSMEDKNLNIPLREMSSSNITLDTSYLSELPKVKVIK